MKSLLLIRHGETEWNSDRKIQGSVDIPLSDAGRVQAAAVAHDLAERGFRADRIFTSDLQARGGNGPDPGRAAGHFGCGLEPAPSRAPLRAVGGPLHRRSQAERA